MKLQPEPFLLVRFKNKDIEIKLITKGALAKPTRFFVDMKKTVW